MKTGLEMDEMDDLEEIRAYPRETCWRRNRVQPERGSFRQRCRTGTGKVSQ